MKPFTYYAIGLLTMVTAGCSTTPKSPSVDATLSQIQPGMSRQAVYSTLGQPAVESNQNAQWDVQAGKDNWRVVMVSFNDAGQVTAIRSHAEGK